MVSGEGGRTLPVTRRQGATPVREVHVEIGFGTQGQDQVVVVARARRREGDVLRPTPSASSERAQSIASVTSCREVAQLKTRCCGFRGGTVSMFRPAARTHAGTARAPAFQATGVTRLSADTRGRQHGSRSGTYRNSTSPSAAGAWPSRSMAPWSRGRCSSANMTTMRVSPTRSERLAAFAVARVLAGQAGGTMLVMDEADDVFTGVDEGDGDKRRGSKIFMNRLVETTAAPTVWITNHPERLGPAVIRRMSLAIRFAEPGRLRRREVVAGIAARHGLALAPERLDRLAAVEPPPPSSSRGCAWRRSPAVAAPRPRWRCARSLRHGRASRACPAKCDDRFGFDPALSSADCDLAGLADRVAASRDPALSFCFHGLPGTGKSAFARHLADRLGVDVVERRASDLLSMWVGETEKGIARAFEEAADRRAMLILDEADALLRDRQWPARAGR